ncbi:CBO0543 family protein [Neobacillus sp. SAB-20_R2A]|uniref:CBO0543 family protein n=1 Tax=Neobacillus sp. SAB-20_R2A TaxID=3120519 RepID=UPI003C6E9E79
MKTLQNSQKIKHIGDFYKKIKETHFEYFDFWLHHTFLHWDFFLSTVLAVIPWIVWIKYRKKESTHRLLFAGFFVLIISSWFDFWGTMYGLWYYTGKVLPSMPSFIPWDFCILPVTIMFLIQYKPKTSPFLKGFIFSCATSFIGEPVFRWIGIYVMVKWSFLYSVPIYFLIYLAADRLSRVKNFAEI